MGSEWANQERLPKVGCGVAVLTGELEVVRRLGGRSFRRRQSVRSPSRFWLFFEEDQLPKTGWARVRENLPRPRGQSSLKELTSVQGDIVMSPASHDCGRTIIRVLGSRSEVRTQDGLIWAQAESKCGQGRRKGWPHTLGLHP